MNRRGGAGFCFYNTRIQIIFTHVSSLDEVGMCWWDAGILEFLINKADLDLHCCESFVSMMTISQWERSFFILLYGGREKV